MEKQLKRPNMKKRFLLLIFLVLPGSNSILLPIMNSFNIINSKLLCENFNRTTVQVSDNKAPDKKKMALIIAIGNYQPETRWTKISSLNDVELIRTSLIQQGFAENNINVFSDASAKKADIINALKDLESKSSPGGVVVIHFSGHGQQIEDDNSDEIDGYDESIIPFDARKSFTKGIYEGENHLRDDELNIYLGKIRSRLGKDGSMLVILDACHSGTGTRGNAMARGTQEVFSTPGYTPDGKDGNENGFVEGKSENEVNNIILAPLVLISGASQNQLNFEYTTNDNISYGSLSYAFSKVLQKASQSTTYRSMFDQIKNVMSSIAPNQSPQIEGELDYKIFGGSYVEQTLYYQTDKYINEKSLTIKAGKLMGLFEGTTVGLYPINTANPDVSKPFVTGLISNATTITSNITLDQPVDEETARNAWIFIREANYGSMLSNVSVLLNNQKELKSSLEIKLNAVKTVKITDSNPDLLIVNVKSRGDETIQLVTSNDVVLCEQPYNPEITDKITAQIIESVKSYTRAELIRNLEMRDSEIDISFRIIPVTVNADADGNYTVDKVLDPGTKIQNGQMFFKPGDVFQIEVSNTGKKEAYFQIIDIAPGNSISILVPSEGMPANEFRISPWKSPVLLPSLFVFSEPYGSEMFKLIATEKEIDLRGIVSSKGTRNRHGEMSPLESLINDSYSQTRADPLPIPPKSASIYTKIIQIIK